MFLWDQMELENQPSDTQLWEIPATLCLAEKFSLMEKTLQAFRQTNAPQKVFFWVFSRLSKFQEFLLKALYEALFKQQQDREYGFFSFKKS